MAVINRVRETGLPSLGHGAPFILTQYWREVEYCRTSWILRLLFRLKSLIEIRRSDFIKP